MSMVLLDVRGTPGWCRPSCLSLWMMPVRRCGGIRWWVLLSALGRRVQIQTYQLWNCLNFNFVLSHLNIRRIFGAKPHVLLLTPARMRKDGNVR
jgi:hypothetical protein